MNKNDISEHSLLPKGALLQMGKYRIEEQLASGGFGNTYEVMNLHFEERYALKEFFMRGINERAKRTSSINVSNRENVDMFKGQLEKFKKEARRLRKLHNPHIVQVHDLFEENNTAYYVMDYVDGESLSNLLKRTNKPLTEAEVLDLLPQILDALETIHNKSIWHLDLKPGNIMVDKSGKVILIDFGASKQISSTEGQTSTSTALCFTPGFAPPEQIDQKMELIGPWTDLYALGATLYNLVTNYQPPTVSEMLEPDAFVYPKPISEKTKELISWLMKPNRQRRPQSVADVKGFLEKPYGEPSPSESIVLNEVLSKEKAHTQKEKSKVLVQEIDSPTIMLADSPYAFEEVNQNRQRRPQPLAEIKEFMEKPHKEQPSSESIVLDEVPSKEEHAPKDESKVLVQEIDSPTIMLADSPYASEEVTILEKEEPMKKSSEHTERTVVVDRQPQRHVDEDKSKRPSKWTKSRNELITFIIFSTVCVLGFLILFIVFLKNYGKTGSKNTDKIENVGLFESKYPGRSTIENPSVTLNNYHSHLGTCTYEGTVNLQNQPHGNGEATFTDGRYYKGPFVNGNFEGRDAYFRYGNGDVFEGEFANNSFKYGRYTQKSDKSYFEGEFEVGQPSKGTWYDSKGNIIETI